MSKVGAAVAIGLLALESITSHAGVDVSKLIETCPFVIEANIHSYYDAISYSGERKSIEQINDDISSYGKYCGKTEGMPTDEFKDALSYRWEDLTPKTSKKVKKAKFDLTKQYTYEDMCSVMKTMAYTDGVYLVKIGQTTSGKDMMSIIIDMTTRGKKASTAEHTVLLTGQVHARETGGASFIMKELVDLVNAYNDGDEATVEMLKHTRFVTVPCINADGHDGIGFDVENWTYSDGTLWKATSSGTDINRNFPGLSWMMLKNGYEQTPYRSSTPNKVYYWGDYGGSANETKALIKFYQFWIGYKKAELLIDYHQQGRIVYTGKGYGYTPMNDNCEAFAKAAVKMQKLGKFGKGYYIDPDDEKASYGKDGTGSTNTDYAWAVALGAKFSTQYGFSVYTDKDGIEYPLVMVDSRDNKDVDFSDILNPEFISMSWEIGYGGDYLGYKESTLKLIEKEYYNYNFDEMLYFYSDYLMNR